MTNHFKDMYQTLNDDKYIKIFKHLYNLRNVTRFSGKKLIQHCSVAEHCYYTTALFILLCFEFSIPITTVDLEIVMHHDILETITGDVLRPAKDFNETTKENWSNIEIELTKEGNYDYLFPYTDYIISKHMNKETYRILKVCDILEILIFCKKEQELGNQQNAITIIIDNCIDYIEKNTISKEKEFIWKLI